MQLDIEALLNEINKLKEKLAVVENDNNNLSSVTTKLISDNTYLKEQLKIADDQHEEQYTKLENINGNLQKRLAAANNKIDQTQSELNRVNNINTGLHNLTQHLNRVIDNPNQSWKFENDDRSLNNLGRVCEYCGSLNNLGRVCKYCGQLFI